RSASEDRAGRASDSVSSGVMSWKGGPHRWRLFGVRGLDTALDVGVLGYGAMSACSPHFQTSKISKAVSSLRTPKPPILEPIHPGVREHYSVTGVRWDRPAGPGG